MKKKKKKKLIKSLPSPANVSFTKSYESFVPPQQLELAAKSFRLVGNTLTLYADEATCTIDLDECSENAKEQLLNLVRSSLTEVSNEEQR